MFGVTVVHPVPNSLSVISIAENGRVPWLSCLWSTASLPSDTFSGLPLVVLFQLGLVKPSTFVETLVGVQTLVHTRVFWPHVKPSHILNVWVWVAVRDLQIYVFKTNVGVAKFNLDKEHFCTREIFADPLIHFLYTVLKTRTRRRRDNKQINKWIWCQRVVYLGTKIAFHVCDKRSLKTICFIWR